jgi:hypothetical protein
MIVNYYSSTVHDSVITIVNYDRKTIIVQVTGHNKLSFNFFKFCRAGMRTRVLLVFHLFSFTLPLSFSGSQLSFKYNKRLVDKIRSLACIIKLITSIIYSFRNKLECFSLNTGLGWKGLPGTNILAYYRYLTLYL